MDDDRIREEGKEDNVCINSVSIPFLASITDYLSKIYNSREYVKLNHF